MNPVLRGDLEHEVGQVGGGQQRVDALTQCREGGGFGQRVELLDA